MVLCDCHVLHAHCGNGRECAGGVVAYGVLRGEGRARLLCQADVSLRLLLEVDDQSWSTRVAFCSNDAVLHVDGMYVCHWQPTRAVLVKGGLQQAHEQPLAKWLYLYTPAPSMLSANMLGQSVHWPCPAATAARASQ